MLIRNAKAEDLAEILNIYIHARELMREAGNPNQWGDNRPSHDVLREDILKERLFLITENNEILAAFVFIIGDEPTYHLIENGSWLNDESYGVIHRIASSGKKNGVMKYILEYCEKRVDNIRIDTHKDNKIMQHILDNSGYIRCGTIYVDDGTPRIAYQKVIK